MNRRDSKIHASDYPVGDKKLIYSSAEVFTWCVNLNIRSSLLFGSF